MSTMPIEYDPLMQGQYPTYPAPQYPMYQEPGPMSQFMSHPGMVGAGAAINNMMAMRRGQAPQHNPMQAMADQRHKNEVLQQRRWEMVNGRQRLMDLQAQRLQQQMNPFYEYEQFRERFPDQAKDMSFAEFNQIGMRGIDPGSVYKTFSLWEQENPDASPEDRQKALENIIRAPSVWGRGGGQFSASGLTGDVRILQDPGYGQTIEGQLAGTKQSAEEQAKTAEGQVQSGLDQIDLAWDTYQSGTTMLNISKQWLERFEGEEVDTGFVRGLMFDMFGYGPEELGDLNAEGVMATLINLGITRLTPITEKEFAKVANLWAQIGNSESVNKGILKNAIERTERMVEKAKLSAVMGSDRIKQWGSDQQYNTTIRSNPFLMELLLDENATQSPDGTVRAK